MQNGMKLTLPLDLVGHIEEAETSPVERSRPSRTNTVAGAGPHTSRPLPGVSTTGERRREGASGAKVSPEIADNLLSWHHSGFSVHGDVRAHDRYCAARLGRYMIRCPLVLDHLPPPRQQLVRYWGYYSNVSRGKRRSAASRRLAGTAEPGDDTASATGIPTALPTAADEPFRRRARLTWAAIIKKIYEIDPLLCPLCGSQMKIIAFITEYPTVCHILEHIQMPAQRPEPLAHSPPHQDELLYA